MSTRFTPGNFRYNGRIAAALIPSLVVLSGFGGKVPMGVTLVGAMVSYMLDAIRYREGALGAIWLTLGGVNLSLWVSGAMFSAHRPFVLSFLMGICSGITLFITGVWATLQFKWIQMRYPVATLAFEKVLLATAFSDASMVQAWGLVAAVGASHAPFYLLPVLCGLFHLLARPLITSFSVRGVKPSPGGEQIRELMVQAPAEGFCATLILTCLPASLYIVIHWSLMHYWVHVWSIVLLVSAPVLFLSILEDGLWWLPGGARQHNAVRRVLCLGALATLIVALEGRVIFPAFGQYIQLHPPWNYAAVTLALYGFAALAVMYLGGLLGEALNSNLAGSVLIVSATVGSIAAGIPVPVLAAPLVSAGGLALALESRQFRDYALFVLGGATTAAWFVVHHFWFLDVSLQGISIQKICVLLWLAILPSLILPGLVMANAKHYLVSATLLVQAGLVAYLEEHLFLGADEIEGEMYPAAMVIATSALGVAVVQRLKTSKKVGRRAAWAIQGIFAAKLSMLVLPQASLPIPAFILILAISSPLLLEDRAPRKGVKSLDSSPRQGVVCMASIFAATLYARFAVFDILHLALGARPSEGALFGSLLLLGAAGCAPLLTWKCSTWREGRRIASFLGISGLLLIFLQPPLPFKGGASCPGWAPSFFCLRLWDAAHAPDHEVDDEAIWAEFGEAQARWPAWVLLGAALSAVTTATNRGSGSIPASRSIAQAALSGFTIGVYIALEFFQGQELLQVVIVAATIAVALILFGLRTGDAASPALLAFMLALWGIAFFVALMAQQILPLPALPEDARRFFADSSDLVDRQRRLNNRAALLAVYSAEALLLAFAMKLKVSAAVSNRGAGQLNSNYQTAEVLKIGNAYAEQAASFLGQCMPASGVPLKKGLRGAAGAALSQLEAEGLGWLPSISNIITVSCFLATLVLSNILTQGSEFAVFLLVPILLLMNQDQFLPALHSGRRYFVLGVAISAFLTASSVWQAFSSWSSPLSVTDRRAGNTLSLLVNLLFTAACIPCHYFFNQYLWSKNEMPGRQLLIYGPMNIAAAIYTDYMVVRILGATGGLMCIGQYIAMSQNRAEGLRLV